MADRSNEVAAVAALNLPLRRRLYDHVRDHPEGVSRDTAAAALDVPRSVAAFNLDKLAEVGLVEVEFRRPEGRSGPGAGRPAKWYHPARRELSVSIPARHYDLAAAILAEALERSGAASTNPEVVREVAEEHGRGAARSAGLEAADPETHRMLLALLAEQGYEPRRCDDTVVMANCPFHALVDDHRDLVCTMNLAFLGGVVAEAGLTSSAAKLDPGPDRCCVTVSLAPRRRR